MSRIITFIVVLTQGLDLGWKPGNSKHEAELRAIGSLNIYNNSTGFNGWIILTLLLSAIGFSMLIFDSNAPKEKEIYYKIGFYDQKNMQVGIIIALIAPIVFIIQFIKMPELSFWMFVPILFFILGISSVIRNIKRIQ